MPNLDQLLDILTILAWVFFIVYVLAVFIRSLLREGIRRALRRIVSGQVTIPFLVTLIISFISAALVFVPPTHVGVVVSLISAGGIRPDPLRPGLHLVVPILEASVQYPVYWQTYTMSAKPSEGEVSGNDSIRARTDDGQEVLIDTSIIFRVNADQVVTLHIDWQDRYTNDYVRPLMRGVVRTQVSQFTAREVNSSARRDLETGLERLLSESMSAKGLLVDRFLIRDVTFTDDYAKSVEAKQIAFEGETRTVYEANQVRNLAAAERDRIATEAAGRAEAILTEAQAQAQALSLIATSLQQNPNLLTYEYITRLSPSIRTMLVPNNAPYLLPLDDLNRTLDSAGVPDTLSARINFTTTVLPTIPAPTQVVSDTETP